MESINYDLRRELLESMVGGDGSPCRENGFEIPERPEKYLAVEYSSGDAVWAMNAATLEEAASDIECSDTSRDDVGVYDLDTGHAIAAEFKVVAFWIDGERVEVKRAPAEMDRPASVTLARHDEVSKRWTPGSREYNEEMEQSAKVTLAGTSRLMSDATMEDELRRI